MKEYKYTIDGNTYEVAINEVNDTTAKVTVNGTEYTVGWEKPVEEKPAVKIQPVVAKPAAAPAAPATPAAAPVNGHAIKTPLPNEGSLDLDLGLAVGFKMVRYDAFTYDANTQHYLLDPANSKTSWSFVPYPIIQEVRVGLVWRFRGIKRKVDRSLIDDYVNNVEQYVGKKSAAATKHMNIEQQRKMLMELIAGREVERSDSTSESDEITRMRLEMSMEINPDTVFTGQDQVDYLRLIKGIKVEDQKKYLLQEEAKKEKEKLAAERKAIKAEEALQDSLSQVRRDSIRAEKAKKKEKKKGKDSEEEKDKKNAKEEKVDKKKKKDKKEKSDSEAKEKQNSEAKEEDSTPEARKDEE